MTGDDFQTKCLRPVAQSFQHVQRKLVAAPMRALQRLTGLSGMALFFLAPNMLIFGIFVLLPLGYSMTGGSALFLPERTYVGGDQYARLFDCGNYLAMPCPAYALCPHMSVRQNLAFGLENARMPKAEIDKRITEAARMLEIEPYLKRRPGQLSGGQRQRVAIGRAIVRSPVGFLLDEPLSNLDAELRVSTRAELAALHARLKATMIYVTHDQVEAMTLADRIVVLRAGRIEQIGTPLELYNTPGNRFVAGFIGAPHMNFLQTTVENARPGHAVLSLPDGSRLEIDASRQVLQQGAVVTLGVRPQHLTLGKGNRSLQATVRMIEALGSETVLHAELAGQKFLVVLPGQHRFSPGSEIDLSLDAAPLHFFDEKGLRLETSV